MCAKLLVKWYGFNLRCKWKTSMCCLNSKLKLKYIMIKCYKCLLSLARIFCPFCLPQTKFRGKVMLLHLSVSHFVGVSAPLHSGIHPLASHPEQIAPKQTPPLGRHPIVGYYRIRSTSGWYASHWNAYLLVVILAHAKHIPSNNISSTFLIFRLKVHLKRLKKVSLSVGGAECWLWTEILCHKWN